MRLFVGLLLALFTFQALPVLAEDYSGSAFLLRDPFITLVGGYATSSSFVVYSQAGARIESGPVLGSVFQGASGTEFYPTYTSPVISATAGAGQVSLSWSASQTYFGGVISSYAVGQATSPGGPYTYTNVGTSLATVVTGLTNGTTYYFVVRATDADQNENTYSSEASATPVAASGGGGGGGGGGGTRPPSEEQDAQVTFQGRAFPNGQIVILKDGQVAGRVSAGSSSWFSLPLEGLSSGTYVFTIYGEDTDGRRSASQAFPVTVTRGSSTTVSGIFIAPTLSVESNQVRQGSPVVLSGQSVPTSRVVIVLDADNALSLETFADSNGAYSYVLDTDTLPLGDYEARAMSEYQSETSNFGLSAYFTVTDQIIPPVVDGDNYPRADLSHDNRVNLVDFAIAGYWYHRVLSDTFKLEEIRHLNGDGKIDLVDFAIMAYYWTG